MRRRSTRIAALVLLLALLVSSASAATLIGYININGVRQAIYKDGDWMFYKTDDGAVIYQYSGKSKDIVIPSVLDGQPVISATTWAVPTGATSVVIPGTFTTLPDRMLYARKSLHTVVLEEGVTDTGAYLCWNCTALQSLTLPASLKTIGSGAFYGCTQMTSLDLGGHSGLTIGTYAFQNWSGLTELTLPSGVVSVGNGAFRSCTSLTRVRMASGVTSIGVAAFADCTALTDLQIGSGVTSIGSEAFMNVPLASVSLPAGLKSLGSYAFENSGIETLDIPDGVTQLDLPVVDSNTVMIVGENTPPHQTILAEDLLNFRLRGTAFVPGGDVAAVTAKERVDEAVAEVIRPGMTDYEKALALHDWLTANAQYDATRCGPDTYEPEGVLLRGAGVCQSYALAYGMLLDAVGIPNVLEYGDDHVWNMVCLDGNWVHVDVTWDDPLSAGQGSRLESKTRSGRENHNYFGLTNEALDGVNSHECTSRLHIAADYHYSYAWRAGTLTKHVNAITAEINIRLARGETSFSFTPSTFGTNEARNNYGINERMSLAVVREQTFTANGAVYRAELSYDNGTRKLTVTLVTDAPQREAVSLGSLTVAPGDVFLIGTEAEWTSGNAAVAAVTGAGTVTPRAAGTVSLTGLTDDREYTLVLTVKDMPSLDVNFMILSEESFAGGAAERVRIGEKVRQVGAGSFTGMEKLTVVYVTGSAAIGEGCFEGCPAAVIFARSGSPAAAFAEANGIRWYEIP